MSVFSKLMFWKKEPGYRDFGEAPGLGPELGLPPMPKDDLGGLGDPGNLGGPSASKEFGAPPDIPPFPSRDAGAPSSFEQNPAQTPQGPMAPPSYAPVPAQQRMPAVQQASSKDIEVVSVKMDTIRQQLDMVNHRLDRIESMLERRYG